MSQGHDATIKKTPIYILIILYITEEAMLTTSVGNHDRLSTSHWLLIYVYICTNKILQERKI